MLERHTLSDVVIENESWCRVWYGGWVLFTLHQQPLQSPHPCSDKPLLLILIEMGLIFQRAKSLYRTSFMIYMEYLQNIKANKLA